MFEFSAEPQVLLLWQISNAGEEWPPYKILVLLTSVLLQERTYRKEKNDQYKQSQIGREEVWYVRDTFEIEGDPVHQEQRG